MSLVNIASISGSVGGPASGIYSASKAAVLLLSESLADEVGPLGIHVTALCPGGFRTNFLDAGLSARHVGVEIGDYDQVHRVVAGYGQLNGRQGGRRSHRGTVADGQPTPTAVSGGRRAERRREETSRCLTERTGVRGTQPFRWLWRVNLITPGGSSALVEQNHVEVGRRPTQGAAG